MARILAVDDEKDILDLIEGFLKKSGHEIEGWLDGQAGLKRAKQDPPDLIILDVMLPGLDGYTVCLNLQADEATRRVPVVVVTAKGRMKETFEALSNVKAFLAKPFDSKELNAAVAKALKG